MTEGARERERERHRDRERKRERAVEPLRLCQAEIIHRLTALGWDVSIMDDV